MISNNSDKIPGFNVHNPFNPGLHGPLCRLCRRLRSRFLAQRIRPARATPSPRACAFGDTPAKHPPPTPGRANTSADPPVWSKGRQTTSNDAKGRSYDAFQSPKDVKPRARGLFTVKTRLSKSRSLEAAIIRRLPYYWRCFACASPETKQSAKKPETSKTARYHAAKHVPDASM